MVPLAAGSHVTDVLRAMDVPETGSVKLSCPTLHSKRLLTAEESWEEPLSYKTCIICRDP